MDMADSVVWRRSCSGFWVAIIVVVATVTGCSRDDSAGAVGRDPQRIEIEVAASGYRPSRVEAKAVTRYSNAILSTPSPNRSTRRKAPNATKICRRAPLMKVSA